MTDRICHAIEIDPIYVDVAVRRWQAFTGREAALEVGGETFANAAERRGIALVEQSDGAARTQA
jgi:hypothetical protein